MPFILVRYSSWLSYFLLSLCVDLDDIHVFCMIVCCMTSLIYNISINRFMFNNLTLLRLAYNHNHHIREPLLLCCLDHMHRGLWDSSFHWAWLWLELLRRSETLVWLFLWHHDPCRILFLLISAYMSIAYIIRFKGMILSIVRRSIMRYKTWLI